LKSGGIHPTRSRPWIRDYPEFLICFEFIVIVNLEDKAVFALIYFYLHIKPYERDGCAATQKEHFLFPPLIDVQTGGGGFSFVK